MNMTKKRKKNYLTDYLYILPAAAFVGIFFVSSILYTFYLSFFEWDGFSEKIFVGLNNYKNLFCDANFFDFCEKYHYMGGMFPGNTGCFTFIICNFDYKEFLP